MNRLLGTGVAHKWECPPGGHYFMTVGKHCSTTAEYQREADRTKKKMFETYTEKPTKREEEIKKGNI